MQWHRKLIENKYCVYVLDRFWSRQLTNNSYCLIALPSIFTFCFIYVWMITSSLGFVYTWSWLDMCPIFQLFIWLLTLGYWNGLARRRYCVIWCCQGLAKLACVEAVFPNTISNGLLAVEVFPKCVYVRTVDSRITAFTMYVFVVFLSGVSFVFCCFAWTCGGSDVNDSYGRRFLSLYSWWSILCLVGMHK